jgi:hypothetical protein
MAALTLSSGYWRYLSRTKREWHLFKCEWLILPSADRRSQPRLAAQNRSWDTCAVVSPTAAETLRSAGNSLRTHNHNNPWFFRAGR